RTEKANRQNIKSVYHYTQSVNSRHSHRAKLVAASSTMLRTVEPRSPMSNFVLVLARSLFLVIQPLGRGLCSSLFGSGTPARTKHRPDHHPPTTTRPTTSITVKRVVPGNVFSIPG